MRTADPHSIASRVAARVLRAPGDRFWTHADFRPLGASPTAVATALSRLARDGTLRRIRRGLYYRPALTAFGESRPNPLEALEVTLRRHETTSATGVDAWRRLGLTAQMGAESEIAAPRRLRLSPVLGHRVRTRVRPIAPGTRAAERAVLDALRALRHLPGTTPGSALERIGRLLDGPLDPARLAALARREPPRIRALLGALLENRKSEGTEVIREELRRSLNPLTRYRMPWAARHLATAGNWGIR